MLNQIKAIYRSVKAAKARSDALVEEGRQMTGWYRSAEKRQNNGQKFLPFQPSYSGWRSIVASMVLVK